MPSKRLPIHFPLAGLSDNLAFGTQPALTTSEATNVRGIDGVTGRTRGAQRNGLSRLMTNPLTAAGAPIQDLVSLTRGRILNTYVQGSPVAEIWNRFVSDDNDVVAVEADARTGDIYALDSKGVIVGYNSCGEEFIRQALPVSSADQIVGRLLVDQFGDIYAAAESIQGSLGRVWKYTKDPDSDGQLREVYRIDEALFLGGIFGKVADIALGAGTLYLLENGGNDAPTESRLTAYTNIFQAAPIKAWDRTTPNPSAACVAGSQGAIYVTAPSNAGRAVSDDGFSVTGVDWGPHDAHPAGAVYDARSQLYYWVDAERLSEFSDGDEVTIWPDNRFTDTPIAGPGTFDPPYDTTDRKLQQLTSKPIAERRAAPHYSTTSFGTKPGIRFSSATTNPQGAPGEALISNGNTSSTGKTVATDLLPEQKSLFPGYAGAVFTTFMVVRFTVSAERQMVLSQNGNCRYRLHMNLDTSGGSAEGICTWSSAAAGGSPNWTGTIPATENAEDFDVNNPDTVFGADTQPANVKQTALLVFHHGGAGATELSCIRVNGVVVDKFTIAQDVVFGTGSGTRIGGPFAFGPEIGGDEAEDADTDNSSDIEVAEIITVLGSTTTTPNDTPLTWNQYGGGAQAPVIPDPGDWGGAFGSVDAGSEDDASIGEYFEGYLAHKWGISHLLPGGKVSNAADGDGYFPDHPFFTAPPVGTTGDNPNLGISATQKALQSAVPITAKYGPNGGELLWAYDNSGQGRDIAVDNQNDVIVIGEADADAADTTSTAIKIDDLGSTFDAATGTSWVSTVPVHDDLQSRLRVDETARGDAYVVASGIYSRINGDDGLLVTGLDFPGAAFPRPAISLAFDPKVPRYDLDADIWNSEADGTGFDAFPPNVYFGQQFLASTQPGTLEKVRLATATPVAGSALETRYLGVAAGEIHEYAPDGTVDATILGQLLATSEFIQSTTLFSRVFWTDGETYLVYTPPRANAFTTESGTVVVYESRTAGEVPPRGRLISAWRQRIVIANTSEDPHSWHMSRLGDPFDWDTAPAAVGPADAIAGANAVASQPPDVVNAIIPYNDDLLLFGGDHSINRLTGDPRAGGQIDLLSDVTGIAFGKAWTKDPDGLLYFFGSRGSVFVMTPGGMPERLTRDSIERRMADIDLTAFRMRLVWNYREEGLHVFQVPIPAVAGGLPTTSQAAWFWDKKSNAWWEDGFGATEIQPTAAGIIDSEQPQDRKVILGSGDGRVRFFDETNSNDDAVGTDAVKIDSRVLIGPFSQDDGYEYRWMRPMAVLADDQSGIRYELMASDRPDIPGQPVAQGVFSAGKNPTQGTRARGAYFWIRLLNSAESERWAFEHLEMSVTRSSRRRTR